MRISRGGERTFLTNGIYKKSLWLCVVISKSDESGINVHCKVKYIFFTIVFCLKLGFNIRGGQEHHCGIYVSKVRDFSLFFFKHVIMYSLKICMLEKWLIIRTKIKIFPGKKLPVHVYYYMYVSNCLILWLWLPVV